MRIGEVKELLVKMINARMPVLLVGAPGVGKSDVFDQSAKECGADLILSHPVTSDPTDAKGLPWIAEDKKSAIFLPFGDLHAAISATKLTVWALDDIGQASPATQASFMQLLLARRVNGHVLPEHVTFVAATNRRTDRAGVSGILEPVKSRFAAIINVESHLDDWSQWALDHAIIPEIIAFLRFRPDLLHQFNPTQDIANQPCPRTWHHASKLVSLQLSPSSELAALTGAIGEGAAGEFIAFLRVYRDLPSLDGIILAPEKAPIPTQVNSLYAVACGLAHKATVDNFGRIATYAERLHKAGKSEFAVLTLRDCVARNKKVTQTQAFIKLVSGDLGKLVAGE